MSNSQVTVFGGDARNEINFLVKQIQDEANLKARELNIHVVTSKVAIQEIYYSTARTLKYLLMNPAEINFYKPAGHLAFWITELKPVRVTEDPATRLARMGPLLDRIVMGGRSSVIDTISRQQPLTLENREFFINEHVALTIALNMITSTQKERFIEDKFPDGDFNGERKKRRDHFLKEFPSLMDSLRYHNYSTRVMSTMFEMMLKTSRL